MIRVRRVDPTKPATAALLQWLQLEVLPLDTPLATDEGVWWVAWHAGQGYRAKKDMSVIIYHRYFGEMQRSRFDVSMAV